jgi:hypothetical protein
MAQAFARQEELQDTQSCSYRTFDGLRTAWKAAGLTAEHAGYPGRLGFDSPGPRVGRMTRFKVTPKFLRVAEGHGVLVRDVQDHFYIEFDMPPELVQLTKPSGSRRVLLHGNPIPSWVFVPGSAVDMDFANNLYFGGTTASLLSLTRASNATDL